MEKTEAPKVKPPRAASYPDPTEKFQLIHKSVVHKSIWVGKWNHQSPLRLPGWAAFFEANKSMATDPISATPDPKVEKSEAQRLAQWFKPIRWGLCNGDGGINEYKGRMFHGWMGSTTFPGLVSQKVTPPTVEEITKAISIVQYPPLMEAHPDVLAQRTMFPAVQVLWVEENKTTYYFVRLNPNLRPPDAQLTLDGSKNPEAGIWKDRKYGD